ncbi:1831_t:CDS:1, partial [Gigaspora rosea]
AMSDVREFEEVHNIIFSKFYYMELNTAKLTECIRLEGAGFSIIHHLDNAHMDQLKFDLIFQITCMK